MDIKNLSSKLRSIASPEWFDSAIDEIAEKTRKDTANKMAYIRNEILNASKDVMTRAVLMMKEEGKSYDKVVSETRKEIKDLISESKSLINNLIRKAEDDFANGINAILELRVKQAIQRIESTTSYSIKEIDKRIKSVKPITQIDKDDEDGKPEHFMDGLIGDNNLETLKRSGDPDNFIIEK